MHPRMIHAKAVMIDDELALAGSANLDGRSLFLNYELMIAFYDRKAVRRLCPLGRGAAAGMQALSGAPPRRDP